MTDQFLAHLPSLSGLICLVIYVYYYFRIAKRKLKGQTDDLLFVGDLIIVFFLGGAICRLVISGFRIVSKLDEGDYIEIVYAGTIFWLLIALFRIRRTILQTKDRGIQNPSEVGQEKSQSP